MRDINTRLSATETRNVSAYGATWLRHASQKISLLSTRNKIKIKTDKKTAAVKGAVFLS